jgi:hypothetical protein
LVEVSLVLSLCPVRPTSGRFRSGLRVRLADAPRYIVRADVNPDPPPVVLVADDDPVIVRLLEINFRFGGYQT